MDGSFYRRISELHCAFAPEVWFLNVARGIRDVLMLTIADQDDFQDLVLRPQILPFSLCSIIGSFHVHAHMTVLLYARFRTIWLGIRRRVPIA